MTVKQVAPGAEAFARLKLAGGSAVAAGGPVHHPAVFAGGHDWRRGGAGCGADPADAGASKAFCRFWLAATPETMLGARIARRGHGGISMSQLVAETGWTMRASSRLDLRSGVETGAVLRIGDLFVDARGDVRLQRLIVSTVGRISQEELPGGRDREGRAARAGEGVGRKCLPQALDRLGREKKIESCGRSGPACPVTAW